jgi:hypothetical protein
MFQAAIRCISLLQSDSGILKALPYQRYRSVRNSVSDQIWEQQTEEPDEWFIRFAQFKLLGGSRSLLRAYNDERLQKSQKKSNSAPPPWRAASKKWNWVDRAVAWDKYQQTRSEKRWEKAKINWEKRREDQREKEWELSQKLIARAELMLAHPLTETETTVDKDGETLTAVIVPAKWQFRDITTCMESASALARSAAGASEQNEIQALNVLREAGWIPEEMIETVGERMDEARERIKAAFVEMMTGEAA